MTDNFPLVSIITPVYNSQGTLEETLRSIQAQSFENWEHILVDDASSDTSRDFLTAYCAQEPRARWIGLDINQGAATARNIAITAAQGRYIAFVDADDTWLPNKLATQLDFMQANDVAFCFSSFQKIDADGALLGQVIVPQRQTYKGLLKNNTIGCLTAIYDTQKLGKVLMPLIRKRQDLGLWLRLLKKTEYAYSVGDVLASYRIRKNSISSNKVNAAKFTWQLYRDVEKLPLWKAGYYFSHYVVNGVLKTYLSR